MAIETRQIRLTKDGLNSIDECLAWLVTKYDQEFADAEFVKIKLVQYMQQDANGPEDAPWEKAWAATISGVREPARD